MTTSFCTTPQHPEGHRHRHMLLAAMLEPHTTPPQVIEPPTAAVPAQGCPLPVIERGSRPTALPETTPQSSGGKPLLSSMRSTQVCQHRNLELVLSPLTDRPMTRFVRKLPPGLCPSPHHYGNVILSGSNAQMHRRHRRLKKSRWRSASSRHRRRKLIVPTSIHDSLLPHQHRKAEPLSHHSDRRPLKLCMIPTKVSASFSNCFRRHRW